MHTVSIHVFLRRQDPHPRLVDEIVRTVSSLDARIRYGYCSYQLCGTAKTGYRIYLRSS